MIDGRIRHSRQRNRTVLRFSSDGDPDVTYICKLDDEEFIYCELIILVVYTFHYQNHHMAV